MAYENLKNAIRQAIKQNGNQEITGSILQNALINIIDSTDLEIKSTVQIGYLTGGVSYENGVVNASVAAVKHNNSKNINFIVCSNAPFDMNYLSPGADGNATYLIVRDDETVMLIDKAEEIKETDIILLIYSTSSKRLIGGTALSSINYAISSEAKQEISKAVKRYVQIAYLTGNLSYENGVVNATFAAVKYSNSKNINFIVCSNAPFDMNYLSPGADGNATYLIVRDDETVMLIDKAEEIKETDIILLIYSTSSKRLIGGTALSSINYAISSEAKSLINNTLKGKKIAFLGDSITQGFNANNQITERWTKICADALSASEVNLGVGSSQICKYNFNGKQPLKSLIGNPPSCATYPDGTLEENNFISRITQNNISDCDYIIVFGGTNDFNGNTNKLNKDRFIYKTIESNNRIGTLSKEPLTENTEFCGALHELIQRIKEVKPSINIIFMTILNRGRYSSGRPTSKESNINGDFIDDYNSAIKDICNYYSIPVIDTNSIFNQNWVNQASGQITNTLTSDGLHPTTAGHKRLGLCVAKWLINNVNY